MSDEPVDTGRVILERQVFTEEDIWDSKAQWAVEQEAARKIWEGLSDEHRDTIKSYVAVTLEYMLDTLEDWVPLAGIKGEGGEYLTFRHVILFTELENEATTIGNAEQYDFYKAKEGMREMLGEVEVRDQENRLAAALTRTKAALASGEKHETFDKDVELFIGLLDVPKVD